MAQHAQQPGRLLGRDHELAELTRRLERGSPVTIVGPAGIGKSRLAGALLGQWGGRSWLVELSRAGGLAHVCETVGLALRIGPQPDTSIEDYLARLGYGLGRHGDALLVLDDADHLVEPVARAVSSWREQAPSLRIVVTSRERLRVVDEQVLDLGPLEPEAARQLFVQRAREVQPGYAPDDAEHAVLTDVVAQLDHLPLGIELAAARMGVLDAAGVRERLSAGLDLLVSDRRATTDRHRSLRSALDISWALLSPSERHAVTSLAVFPSDFELDAAEALLGADALCRIEALLHRSLLRRRAQSPPRFAFYQPIRAYVLGRLDGSDPDPSARARLSAWLGSAVTGFGAERLRRERPTLEAVVREALEGPACSPHRPADVLAIALALGQLAQPASEQAARLGALIERAGDAAAPGLLARAEAARASALLNAGHFEQACEAAARARRRARPQSAMEATLEAWIVEGRARYLAGSLDEADRALRHASSLDARAEQAARIRWALGAVQHARGELEAATRSYREALLTARRRGDRRAEAESLARLGFVACDGGQHDDAERHLRDAITLHRTLDDPHGEAVALGYLGNVERGRGHFVRARDAYRRAREVLEPLGNRQWLCVLRMDEGILLLCHEQPIEAWTELRQAADDAEAVSGRRIAGLSWGYAAVSAAQLSAFDEADEYLSAAHGQLDDSDALRRVLELQRAHVQCSKARRDRDDETLNRIARWLAHDAAAPLYFHERIVRGLLERMLGAAGLGSSRHCLRVRTDGRVFALPGEDGWRPELPRGPGRLLRKLAEARAHRPGDTLTVEELFQAGWPTEQASPTARVNRVRVGIASLRKAGLRPLLLTRDGGYLIDPATEVRVEAPG